MSWEDGVLLPAVLLTFLSAESDDFRCRGYPKISLCTDAKAFQVGTGFVRRRPPESSERFCDMIMIVRVWLQSQELRRANNDERIFRRFLPLANSIPPSTPRDPCSTSTLVRGHVLGQGDSPTKARSPRNLAISCKRMIQGTSSLVVNLEAVCFLEKPVFYTKFRVAPVGPFCTLKRIQRL